MNEALEDRKIGRVTVLYGERRGCYPHGNSLLVTGTQETVLIDPSLGVIPRRPNLPKVERLILSHCHEDHIAGSFLFPDIPWHFHDQDLPGILSLEGMMAIYGFPEPIASAWQTAIVERFHFTPRPDPESFQDGDVFDLGGARIRVIHAPGHTRGHSVFLIEPDDVLYLGDIDLSSFGPYYGDAWSDLESFEATLDKVRAIDARHYATFHHIGVLEGRDAFLERFDRFVAVIADREARLLAYLSEPHTLDEIAEHRFVYRPQDDVPFASGVERRSMGQHLERLVRRGAVREVEAGRFLAA